MIQIVLHVKHSLNKFGRKLYVIFAYLKAAFDLLYSLEIRVTHDFFSCPFFLERNKTSRNFQSLKIYFLKAQKRQAYPTKS